MESSIGDIWSEVIYQNIRLVPLNADEPLREVASFRCLDSYVSSKKRAQGDVIERVNRTCSKWNMFSGVLFEVHISLRLQSKICREIIRLAAIYGSACWLIIKKEGKRASINGNKNAKEVFGNNTLQFCHK